MKNLVSSLVTSLGIFVVTLGIVIANLPNIDLSFDKSIVESKVGFLLQHKEFDIYLKDTLMDYTELNNIEENVLNKTKDGDVVVFHLAGYGGNLEVYYRLIDLIKSQPAKVIMKVEAPVYSGHAYLAISGNEIIMEPFTYLMFHTSSLYGTDCSQELGTDRTVSNAEHCQALYDNSMNLFYKFLDELPILTKEEKELIRTGHDVFLTPEQVKSR